MSTNFDAIVIGAGQAGPSLAGRLTAAGMTVALVERKLFGGTCVNTGCMPTKTLVASAYAATSRAPGRRLRRRPRRRRSAIDMKRVKARADTVSAQLAQRRREAGCAAWTAAPCSRATPASSGRTTVEVGDELLDRAADLHQCRRPRARARHARRSATSPTSTNTLDARARHAAAASGRRRRQLHRPRVRADVPPLRRRGHGRREGAAPDRPRGRGRLRGDPRHPRGRGHRRPDWTPSASASRRTSDGVAVGVDCTDGAPEVVGSHVLLAVGRRPNTDDLGLDEAGVATDARGYITVDDGLATNVARHLGARRLQRPRRLHPHRLQRFRDRRRQPARRRRAARSATASRPTRSTSTRRSAASA